LSSFFSSQGGSMFLSGLLGYYAAYVCLSAIAFLVCWRKLRECNGRGILLFSLAILIGGMAPFAVQLLGPWTALALLSLCAVLIAARLTVLSANAAEEEQTEAVKPIIMVGASAVFPPAGEQEPFAARGEPVPPADMPVQPASGVASQDDIERIVEKSQRQADGQEEMLLLADELFSDQVEDEGNNPGQPETSTHSEMELLPADGLWAEAEVLEGNAPVPEGNPVIPAVSEQAEDADSLEEEIIYRFDEEESLPVGPASDSPEEQLVSWMLEAEEPIPAVAEDAASEELEALSNEVVAAGGQPGQEALPAAFSREQQELVQLHYQTALEAMRHRDYTVALPELANALQYPVPAVSRMIMTADYVSVLQEMGLYRQSVQAWEQALEKLTQTSSDPAQLQRFETEIKSRIRYIEIVTELLREHQKPNLPWPLVPENIRQMADARFAEWKNQRAWFDEYGPTSDLYDLESILAEGETEHGTGR
jgi:tetratricopeptide (TPR) repeat protein